MATSAFEEPNSLDLKRGQILKELSLLVATMESLQEVLGEIVELTSDDAAALPNSVAQKQEKLMKELSLWKNLQQDATPTT